MTTVIMKIIRFFRRFAAVSTGWVIALLVDISTANAQLVNPGFENGLTGWTVASPSSGGSWFSQTGASSPINGFTVASPVEGGFAAMTDQIGPGSQVLFQDFVVPASVAAANLSFSYTIHNAATAFVTASNLTFASSVPNQQARVDIIRTSADVFSTVGGDVLLNIFQTQPGDPPNTGGYASLSTDLTALFQAHAGETLRLRFAEADNQLYLNFGVDNVQLSTRLGAVPEPSTYGIVGAGTLVGLIASKRSRGRHAGRGTKALLGAS